MKSEQSRAEKAEAVIGSVTAERDEHRPSSSRRRAVDQGCGAEGVDRAQERSKLKPLQEKAVELSAAMARRRSYGRWLGARRSSAIRSSRRAVTSTSN